MRQLAWLDVFDGKWLFLDGNLKDPARSWEDEEAALSELLEEGWTIIAPHRNHRLPGKSKQNDCGYVMARTVH